MEELLYSRERAVEYAHKWAFSRNPKFFNFDSLGGDCTNFASQCIFAGANIMNFTPIFGWFYRSVSDRTASWTGVEFLYNFLTGNEGVGPYAKEVPIEEVLPGDIVQINFSGNKWAHSPVVVQVKAPVSAKNILVAAHTYDADNRPLSQYNYKKVRGLHILGVRG